MKNLLIYINLLKKFDEEHSLLAKIQIDNSLELGWKKEDILLVTNFKYSYRGIKAIVSNENLCSFAPTASKIFVICDLFKRKVIKGENSYWFHDLDAFQTRKMTERRIKNELGDKEMALTDYGRNLRWSTGSIFFYPSARDIFFQIKKGIIQNPKLAARYTEEGVLGMLTANNLDDINDRIKKINITYNFATRNRHVNLCYQITDKPVMVLHFHPFDKRPVEDNFDSLDILMYGRGKINKVLMTRRLIKLFHKYGIK